LGQLSSRACLKQRSGYRGSAPSANSSAGPGLNFVGVWLPQRLLSESVPGTLQTRRYVKVKSCDRMVFCFRHSRTAESPNSWSKQSCCPPPDPPPKPSDRLSSLGARGALVSSPLVASKSEAFNPWPKQIELRSRFHHPPTQIFSSDDPDTWP